MKFKLPILEEEFDIKTKEATSKKTYIDCDFDFSIDAQVRWEENFPELSKTIGVFDYVEKMKGIKIENVETLGITLKIIYSFIILDRKMTFREFSRLFTLSNQEYFNELSDTVYSVIDYILKTNESKKKS